MGLFEFFRKKDKGVEKEFSTEKEQVLQTTDGPTEEQFIDNSDPENVYSEKSQGYTLNDILNFASIDFEDRGYHDALINPETSYKNENIELLFMDLDILVQRAKNSYYHSLQMLDFHINSRKDAGLIDIVNELEARKSKLKENLSAIKAIEDDTDDSGLRKRIRLSYNRGFNRGLASMSADLLQSNTL